MARTPRKIYKPDFPVHNYIELQKSSIPNGDRRQFPWGTTYNDAMRPRKREDNAQQIDTIMLQKTHWNQGDLSTTKISEYKDEYRDFSAYNVRPTQEITQEMMMKTNFSMDDGITKMERTKQNYTAADVTPSANLKEMMTATHFDLTSKAAPKWETTNQAAFNHPGCKPSELANMELNRGYGAKSSFQNLAAYPTPKSLAHDSYRDYGRAQTALARTKQAYIENGEISFVQGTTQKWQGTTVNLGDTQQPYRTTTQDGFAKRSPNDGTFDPRYARERKLALQVSSINKGNNFPTVKTTTMHDAHVAHPGFKPPPEAEKTAFLSHQDHRNWDGRPSTTYRDAFVPKKAEKVDPVNNQLQQSHASFGNSQIHEMQTLYRDTYKKHPKAMELADMDAAREFNMGHHTKDKEGDNIRTETTTYRRDYHGWTGVKPSDMCEALKGGNNIVANDPRLVVKQSAMKDDYIRYKNVEVPSQIDNALQRSHIQLTGSGEPWTTTQQDYFLFKTYKMPEKAC